MSTNIDALLEKAEKLGSETVPEGSGNSPEIQGALMRIFEAHPTSWFRSKDLGEALNATGFVCKKVSDVLFAMRKAGKIKKARKGVYGLDANNTIPDEPADNESED